MEADIFEARHVARESRVFTFRSLAAWGRLGQPDKQWRLAGVNSANLILFDYILCPLAALDR